MSLEPRKNREWWPSEAIDEIPPTGRDTPNDWLLTLDDGAQGYGSRNEGDGFEPRVITEGQIVPFTCCDTLEDAVLTFGPGGSFEIDPPVPAGAMLMVDGDTDTVSEDADQLVEILREAGEADEGTKHDLTVYRWSDDIPLRFTAQGGPPRFEIAPKAGE